MIYHPSNYMMNIIVAILNNTPRIGYHILTVLLSPVPFMESLELSYHPIRRKEQHKKSLQNSPILASSNMPEFVEMSPPSGPGKHPDFQVTSCHHFDTTNVDFAYIESE